MSTPPDQNAAFKAMFQAGSAMAQGFGQFLAEQQQKLSAAPAGPNPAAWTDVPDGGTSPVTITPLASDNKFYRLRRQ